MAEKDIIEAVKVGKTLAKKPTEKKKKKSNVQYFPILRSIAIAGGVAKMINLRYVKAGLTALSNGDIDRAGDNFSKTFEGGDVVSGAKIISTGVVLGKALDALKANPRIKMGKYGIKLV